MVTERNPSVRNIGGLTIKEFETYPYPRPLCPNCHANMRWFEIQEIGMKGWFCICPSMVLRDLK